MSGGSATCMVTNFFLDGSGEFWNLYIDGYEHYAEEKARCCQDSH